MGCSHAACPGAVNGGEGNQNSMRLFGRPQEGNLRLVISTDFIAEFRVNSLPFAVEGGVGVGTQINLGSKT